MRISRSFHFPNRRLERRVKLACLVERERVVQRRHGVGPIGFCVMGLDSNV